MGQDPSDIRAEIEATRARVGDEVDALSYKTDVPARVGDYVDDKKQAVKDKVSGVKDAIVGTTSDAVQTTSDALPSGQQLGKLKDTAERNPLGLAIGGAAIGFVAGTAAPIDPTRGPADGRNVGQGDRRRQGDSKRRARKRQADRRRCCRYRERAGPGARLEPPGPRAGITRKLRRPVSRMMVVSGPLRPGHNQIDGRKHQSEEAEVERSQSSTSGDPESADEPFDNNRPGDRELPGERTRQ